MEDRIGALEKTVLLLKTQIERLSSMADKQRHQFTYLMLENGITKEQEGQIVGLMQEVREQIRKGEVPMHHATFEQKVYEIVPTRNGDYHFVENIVICLTDTGQFPKVYKYMKKSGMNLP